MADYVTLNEMKNSLELMNLTYADADLADAISAASMGVDAYTGRRFTSSGGTAEVRYYTATRSDYVTIDDIQTLTALQTDYDGDGVYETSWTVGTDYTLEPANAPALELPYNEIRVHRPNTSLRFSVWPNGVKVTGEFGWNGGAPAPIKVATKIMASRLLQRQRNAPFGVVAIGFDNTAVRVPQIDPDLHYLLDSYRAGGGVLVA